MAQDDTTRQHDGAKPEQGLAEVTVVEARDILGELVNRAGYANERIVLTKYGKPIAAIVGTQDLAALQSA